jgi:hypothetical protein
LIKPRAASLLLGEILIHQLKKGAIVKHTFAFFILLSCLMTAQAHADITVQCQGTVNKTVQFTGHLSDSGSGTLRFKSGSKADGSFVNAREILTANTRPDNGKYNYEWRTEDSYSKAAFSLNLRSPLVEENYIGTTKDVELSIRRAYTNFWNSFDVLCQISR